MSIFRKIKYIEKEKIVEVERVVFGEPHRVRLFHAYKGSQYQISFMGSLPYEDLGVYLTCKEAFDAAPECQVEELSGIRIGDEYFVCDSMRAIKITKPKRRGKTGSA